MPCSRVTGWSRYIHSGYSFVEFEPGMWVLDVGCGDGLELEGLRQRGCRAVGIDVSPASVSNCRKRGLNVLRARAEEIPVREERVDGVLCKVTIPYTDEARALQEIARVLKVGAKAYVSYHGAGYYFRYLLIGVPWRFRFYGLRTLVNTWLYVIVGRRLPGFLGDSLYQSQQRLARYYHQYGLVLLQECCAKFFFGFPVFIYHTIQKAIELPVQTGTLVMSGGSSYALAEKGERNPSPIIKEGRAMLKALWNGWLVVARKIGYFNSLLVLTVVYFVVIAPFALAVRFFSDPLRLRGTSSWQWVPRDGQSTPTLNSVRQQF